MMRLFFFLFVAGCSSASPCQSKKYCPKDPEPMVTDGQRACEAKKCENQSAALQNCIASKIQCKNDTTDGPSFVAANLACNTELKRYDDCLKN